MRLSRRTIGAIVGGTGTLTCVGSAYLDWRGQKAPRDMPIRHLVQATATGEASTYWTSMAAPLAVLGILGVLGALLRFRLLLGFAWMTGVAVTVLWILMRVISSATSQSSESADLRYGVWVCVAGLVIIMVGIAVMGPRREEIEAPLSVFDDDDDPPE